MTDELGNALGEVVAGRADRSTLGRLTRLLSDSARGAGAAAVASGRWIAEVFVDVAPRIPIRDLATLSAQHGDRTGDALAEELVRHASYVSGGVGGAAGALMAAEQLAPPAWLLMPLELVVETLAVAAVELKLVAELHEVYGRALPEASGDRATALLKAWAERRGVSVRSLTQPKGVANALGRSTRNEIIRIVRRRLMRRMGRNLSSMAPLLIGAVAGAELNRRATRTLGETMVRDLGRA